MNTLLSIGWTSKLYVSFTSTCPSMSFSTVILSFTSKGQDDTRAPRRLKNHDDLRQQKSHVLDSFRKRNGSHLKLSIFRILVYLVIYDTG